MLNCHLADTALHWSPKYFLQNIENNNLTVYLSRSRRFLYYNEAINMDGRYNWTPPHQRTEMNFSTFMRLVSEIERVDNGTRVYLQVNYFMFILKKSDSEDFSPFLCIYQG